MSKVKFKLVPNPTFDHPVPIPMPGSKPVPVQFTFKHRDREEFQNLLNDLASMDDEKIFKELVAGWELEDEFNNENITKLLLNYHGACRAILDEYIKEQGALRDTVLGK